MTPDSILIFVHPPFYKVGDTIFFDAQAQNGLRLWAQNFEVVRIMAPLVETPEGAPSDAKPLQPFLDAHPSVEPVMMPRRGTLGFLRDMGPGRKVIEENIRQSQYLVFGFSGYFGDWGTMACRIAQRMGRPYAVFKDGVAHRVLRIFQEKQERSALTRLRHWLERSWMERSDRKVVERSTVALLHGQDTLEYYGGFASNPQLVHNIHISKADHISAAALDARLAARTPGSLKIVYAGRVEEIKGPDHWTKAAGMVRDAGIPVSASWFGTGTLFEEQVQKVTAQGLEDVVTFEGFVPHAEVQPAIQAADVFLFTHMTEESPRCLIEALAAGLPLVGFDSAYARDLVDGSNAGLFVPRGDAAALGAALTALAQDPERLKAMALDARRVAEPFNDEDVFKHRGDVIKKAL